MKKNRSIFILLICLIVVSFVSVVHEYMFDIYTYGWHILNHKPIVWNNLVIETPDKLVARIVNNNHGVKNIHIYYPASANQASIFFTHTTYFPRKDSKVEKKYLAAGYTIIEKKDCNVSGASCLQITSINKIDWKLYSAIYFDNNDTEILFIGNADKKYLFDNLLSTLKKKQLGKD